MLKTTKLMKEIKDMLYAKYISIKEKKEDEQIIRHIPCSWTGRVNIVNMSILH